MQPLTVLAGGRNQPELIEVERREYDELRVELACSLAERAVAVANMRPLARAAQRALSSGHDAAAALWLSELTKLLEREGTRAAAAAAHQGEAQQLTPALELVQVAA
jgi:electron transfer flavoprotein alpha/beta subunit